MFHRDLDRAWGYFVSTPILENQKEKNMEHVMGLQKV